MPECRFLRCPFGQNGDLFLRARLRSGDTHRRCRWTVEVYVRPVARSAQKRVAVADAGLSMAGMAKVAAIISEAVWFRPLPETTTDYYHQQEYPGQNEAP